MTATPSDRDNFVDEAVEDSPALDEGDAEPDALTGAPVDDDESDSDDGAEGGDDGG